MEYAMATKQDFESQLASIFGKISPTGLSFIDVKAGDLHRIVGDYPGPNHRMPVCCDVMYDAMNSGDEILNQPPKGKGANLVIRYYLPR
jgi:hypothetical protein